MILEYLILDKKLKEEILDYKKENLNIKIQDIKDSDFWLAEFIVDEENEQGALVLSKINEDIIKHYNCITLTNESSFYYNKKLYPLINEFERKLRKILYLASKLSDDSPSADIIHNLEEMDFGTLFELIFTDDEFIKNVKIEINNKGWKYNKSEIIDELFKIEEKTLWDKLLGADTVPTLQENFIIIKNYRNNIMHAHNITAEDYKRIEEIFLVTNKELDSAISDILDNKIKKLDKDSNQNFSKRLKAAIDAEAISQFTNDYNQQLKDIAGVAKFVNDMGSMNQQLKDIAGAAKFANGIGSMNQQLKDITGAAKFANGIGSMNQQLKDIAGVAKFANGIGSMSNHLKEKLEDISTDYEDIDNGNEKEDMDDNA